MAKRAKVSESVDLISSLPDEILRDIISFLSLKEATRTSILSKRWSRISTFLSNLEFEDGLKGKRSHANKYMCFVDRFLFHHTGDVNKLGLACGRFIDPYRIDGWIRYALAKNVREFDFLFKYREFNQFNLLTAGALFTCKTLVSLRLNIACTDFVLNLPDKIRLPCLKILHLVCLRFDSIHDSLQKLFSSCLVLEELSIERCKLKEKCRLIISNPTMKRLNIIYTYPDRFYMDSAIVIDAPSLVYFRCTFPATFLLQNPNSISEVYLDFGTAFNCYDSSIRTKPAERDLFEKAAADLFKGISNVQSLHLSGYFAEGFLKGFGVIPMLTNLTCLNLEDDFFVGWEKLLPDLLKRFPRLEALVLKVGLCRHSNDDSDDDSGGLIPSDKFPSFLWSQLKTLKISSFDSKTNELQIIKYFLKNVKALEKFTVQARARKRPRTAEWRSRMTIRFSKLLKVSKDCKVSVV